MSKLAEKMFGKNCKATFNFVDLDDRDKILHTAEISGRDDEAIEYDPQEEIDYLLDQGYVLAANDFARAENQHFSKEDQTLQISFRHARLKITAANPSHGYNKDQLERKLQQIVHYEGAANRTPEDSVTEVNFEREVEIDQVTGQVVNDSGWQPESQNFMIIGTPTLPGFVPDQTAIGGDRVTAEDGNQEYTVNFKINDVPSSSTQSAVVKFVDIRNGNQEISVEKLSGQANMPIKYNPQNKIAHLESEGFQLIHNGFNGDGDIQFFGNADSYEPIFIITMKYTAIAVNKDHPNNAIDPHQYEKETKFTVEFLGARDATPAKIVQTAHWSRTITVIPSKKQIIANGVYDTAWKADIARYQDVTIPVIEGYHSRGNIIKAVPVTEEDQLLTVTYEKNGHLIPVDEDGEQIPNAPQPIFENDPDHAGEVRDDQIVPKVDGYKCDLMTVTPDDPGKDLEVRYQSVKKEDTLYVNLEKDKTTPKAASEDSTTVQPTTAPEVKSLQKEQQQVAIVNFIDVDHHGLSLTSSGTLLGKPGESINELYSTEIPLKVLKKAGYHVVFNNFDVDGSVQRFNSNDLLPQIFTIGVSKRKSEEARKQFIPVNEKSSSLDLADDDLETKLAAFKKATEQLKKIKPTSLPKDNGHNSQTVKRLLDIVTTLLNLIFVLSKGDNQDK